MPGSWILAIGSVALVSGVSLLGAVTLSWDRTRVERISARLVAFAAGGLYGDAFFHLIPESLDRFPGHLTAPLCVMAGIIAFFVVERLLHRDNLHQRLHHARPMVAVNLIGDALHNAIDGMLIGASYSLAPGLGLTTTLAVLLHEIPQELGDFAILLHGGVPARRALGYNLLSGLAAVLGAVVALVLGARVEVFTSALVPITAGGFVYLAGSDLLPELQHEAGGARTTLRQILMIAAGVALMAALTVVE